MNGTQHHADVPVYRTLADMLRYDLGLTGTKEACGVGVCGACAVLLDGTLVASCLTFAFKANGARVETVEGLATDGRLHPLQESFIAHGGFQCGACTPGQLVAAKALLDADPEPTEAAVRAWMMGNLCRCTGYYQILEAIVKATASTQRDTAG